MTIPLKSPAVTLEAMQSFLAQDFPQLKAGGMDFELEALGFGTCTARLKYHVRHLRPGGTMSGPSMFALADVALYIAVLSTIGIVPLAVTTGITINFLNKPEARDLIAQCKLLKIGKSLCVGEVTIYSDGNAAPVAHVTGTYSVPKLSPPG